MQSFVFFFFNDTATTEIYTLSLHDALPISGDAYRPDQLPAAYLRRRPPLRLARPRLQVPVAGEPDALAHLAGVRAPPLRESMREGPVLVINRKMDAPGTMNTARTDGVQRRRSVRPGRI